MHRVRATGGPAALVHSRDLAAAELWWTLLSVHGSCSPADRLLSPCPNRELTRACAHASAVDRREFPSDFLRLQSHGYSLPAPPAALPPKEHQVRPFPVGTSGRLRLARAGPQSHVPSACP